MPRHDANKENEDPNPPRVKTAQPSGPKQKFGKHETMPVLATDVYRDVTLPELNEFNPEDIKLDGTIVAVGKRRTGKTWIFRNLMYLMKDMLGWFIGLGLSRGTLRFILAKEALPPLL